MAKKKELSEEEKIDEQIVELLMKKTGHRPSAQEVGSIINKMYGKVIQRLLMNLWDMIRTLMRKRILLIEEMVLLQKENL